MRNVQKSLLAALIAAGLMSTHALAQDTQPQQAPQQAPAEMQQSVPDISESDIESFADAYVHVQQLNQEYTAKLQAAEDENAATELQQEGQEKMRDAITDSGLTLEEYRQIANAANQSPEVQQRLGEAIEAAVGEDS